ncbi:PAS domain S-box-containing protein [Gillisia sp. Hel_I_86]|uniref:PAS domain S-box protein n=1 Tax=Gillisia sp. Hel_I_86 TaxID=1249981 RepID=UPI001198DB29|nr:PAS domain S-box protein [Gillisia sp. Hel_I_86]TVZ28429.1 PAS domain S-box-containing protein [Gillisia sp. Hel_I_86]
MNSTTHNKDLYRHIFEASLEGIIAVNEDGRILTTNPACEELFGYKTGELIGENIEILIPENLKRQYKIYIKKQIIPPKRETDILGIKKDGSKFNLNIGLSPTVIDGKKAAIAFFWDATQHTNDLGIIKETNAKLIESNRKFDVLINNQKGIVFQCKNNRNYDMEYISEGCLEVTGHPSEAFKNQAIAYGKLILAEERDTIWKKIQNAVKQRKPYSAEYRIKSKDGTIKHVWEKGKAVYQDDKVMLNGFIADITPQKETELELRRSEAKIKALLEANPDIMFIQDQEGVFLDWYADTPQKLFMPPEKFIGVNMKKVLPPNIYKIIKKSHNRVIESGKMQIAEYSVPGTKGLEHYETRAALMNNQSLLTIVRDVTEERTKDALLTIQNNALASASNSIVIADAQQPHTPIIYCNAAFESMTGYSKEEVLGRNCHFLQKDDRNQRELDIMKTAIAHGESCNVIVRNYRKDGTMFWNDISITPVHNERNRLTHFIGVQNDVTNKVNEEQLKDKIRKILGLIVQDKQLKTIGNKIVETFETYSNDCMASVLLLDTEHKTLHTLVAPNLPKSFSNYIEGVRLGPKLGTCATAVLLRKEITISNIPRSFLWENYNKTAFKNGLKAIWSFPITSSTKQVLGLFAIYSHNPRKLLSEEIKIIMDMTRLTSIAIEKHNNALTLKENRKELKKYARKLEEKVQERTQEVMATVQKLVESNLHLEDQILITKQAQKNAKTSKNIASEIAKNFPNGFVAVINRDLKVVFAEGEALTQLGLKQSIIKKVTLDDITFFSDERKARIKENIVKTLAGQHLSFEVNYKGRYFAVNTAPLVDENNKISNALHVYSDISQQKEIEFTIQNALKKERELNELKSRFVSMASHEFRTPLSAILTSAILIGKQNEPGKELKREKYLSQIERNVNNLTVILNDFLSLSKLEEGKVVALPERFDLVSFSKMLVKQTSIGLKKKQTLRVLSSYEELYVHLDVKLLSHIINNLLSNASKYSPEASSIDFKISQRQENVVIQITDQGIGIPKEELAYLFGRFFRAKNAVNIEGTGLGLNIVKNYTELMGGTIEVKSGLNTGTTFLVELPIHKQ